jgi:excinuclease UvrABC helicase subunit UvrB
MVIFYAETITGSMQQAINETNRRRRLQMAYNEEHGITPESIVKSIEDVLSSIYEKDYYTVPVVREAEPAEYVPRDQIPALIVQLEKEMRAAAKNLEFERAAELRDRIQALERRRLGIIEEKRAGVPPRTSFLIRIPPTILVIRDPGSTSLDSFPFPGPLYQHQPAF